MSRDKDELRLPLLVAACLVATTQLACGPTRPKYPEAPPPLSAAAYSHYLRGRVALLDGKPKQASIEFGRAAQLLPDQPEVVVAYAEALLESDKSSDATAIAIRAATKWPKRFDTSFIAGSCLFDQKQHERALPYLSRAHSIEPTSLDAAIMLARLHVALKQPNAAIEIYLKTIEATPSAIGPRTKLAKLYDREGRVAEAETAFKGALAIRPNHLGALIALSNHLEAKGRASEAVDVLTGAAGKAVDKDRFIERLAVRLMKGNRHRRIAVFLETLDRTNLSSGTRLGIARLLIRLGYPARALVIADKIRTENPTAPEGRLARADALTRLHRYKDASEEIAKLPPTGDQASRVVYQAELLTLAGEPQQAIEMVKAELMAKEPSDDPASKRLSPLGLLTVSRIHELSGRAEDARRYLRAALSEAPGDDGIRFSAAVFELRAQQFARARNYAEPLLARERNNPALQNFVGFCLLEKGQRLDRASKLIRAALEARPDDPNIIDSYGWLQFRRGQHIRALKILLRAWRLAPAEPEILLHLGEVELALGRRPAARRRFERALALATEPSVKLRIQASLSGFETSAALPKSK